MIGVVGFYTARLTTERDRARLQAEKASRLSELLTRLLTGADPYRTPDATEPTVQSLLDIGAERIARELGDQPELQAEMFTLIGRTYQRMGLHTKALPLLQQALGIGRRAFGPVHIRVAQSLNDLGGGYMNDFYAREFWRFVLVQQKVAELAKTAVDYPPMQDPASFNLDAVKKKLP